MNRREVLRQSAKLVWTAPVMTKILSADCCNRFTLQMYKARFVPITSPDQTYESLCDAGCRSWFEKIGQDFEHIRTEVGGVAAIPTRDGF